MTSSAQTAAEARPSRGRLNYLQLTQRYGMVVVLALLIIVFSMLRPEHVPDRFQCSVHSQ